MITNKGQVVLNVARVEYNKPFSIVHTVSGDLLDLHENDTFKSKGDIDINLEAEMAGENILVRGSLKTTVVNSCARCLEKYDVLIDIDDYYEYFDDFDDQIDLTDTIRESILLAFPSKGLCDENCSGICFSCGINLNKLSCSCTEQVIEDTSEEETSSDNIWGCLDNLDFTK